MKGLAMTNPKYPRFNSGDLVRDVFGKAHRVLFQRGCQVFFVEGGWCHPTKCWA
jgi:hypothetical protein